MPIVPFISTSGARPPSPSLPCCTAIFLQQPRMDKRYYNAEQLTVIIVFLPVSYRTSSLDAWFCRRRRPPFGSTHGRLTGQYRPRWLLYVVGKGWGRRRGGLQLETMCNHTPRCHQIPHTQVLTKSIWIKGPAKNEKKDETRLHTLWLTTWGLMHRLIKFSWFRS